MESIIIGNLYFSLIFPKAEEAQREKVTTRVGGGPAHVNGTCWVQNCGRSLVETHDYASRRLRCRGLRSGGRFVGVHKRVETDMTFGPC